MNEKSFRITSIKQNFPMGKTALAKNFRWLKNSSLPLVACPSYGWVGQHDVCGSLRSPKCSTSPRTSHTPVPLYAIGLTERSE